MIELYLTVLSFLIFFKGLISFVYYIIFVKTKYIRLGINFYPNKLLHITNKNYWPWFWLSGLWLSVYYFDFIKQIIRGYFLC